MTQHSLRKIQVFILLGKTRRSAESLSSCGQKSRIISCLQPHLLTDDDCLMPGIHARARAPLIDAYLHVRRGRILASQHAPVTRGIIAARPTHR